MATKIQQDMADVQNAIFSEDYFTRHYTQTLGQCGMTASGIDEFKYDDRKIISFANDFWFALPDASYIRTGPFFDLCNICESEYDEQPDDNDPHWDGAPK